MSDFRLSDDLLEEAIRVRQMLSSAELADASDCLRTIDEEGEQDDLAMLRDAMEAAEDALQDAESAADALRDLIAAALKEQRLASGGAP